MPDFLPRPDGDFAAWANHYVDRLQDWWAAHGLDTDDLIALKDALSVWNESYPAHVAAQAAAEAACNAKDAARAALIDQIRPTARIVQAYPDTTNADRANLGITVREGVGRVSNGVGRVSNPPTSRPLVRIDTGQRLLHTIRFSDESTPTRRRKPHGVLGAEVWIALEERRKQGNNETREMLGRREQGNKETREESYVHANGTGSSPCSLVSLSPCFQPLPGFRFLSVSTSGVLQADFPSEEAGKTAYYALRWLSTRGETGPWSEIAAATVAA